MSQQVPQSQQTRAQRRPRRRGLGCLIAFLVVFALLLGVLVAADRIGRRYANDQVAQQVQTQLGLAQQPTVDITGFPFLTQVAANRFDRVVVDAADVSTGGSKPMTVQRLRLDLGQVVTGDNFSRATAGTLTGSAEIAWPEVQRAAGVPVTPLPDGRVELKVSPRVLGQQATVLLRGRPALDVAAQSLRVTDVQAEVAGYQLPDSVVSRVVEESVPAVPLQLPLGVRAGGLQVDAQQLTLDLSGQNIVLAG